MFKHLIKKISAIFFAAIFSLSLLPQNLFAQAKTQYFPIPSSRVNFFFITATSEFICTS